MCQHDRQHLMPPKKENIQLTNRPSTKPSPTKYPPKKYKTKLNQTKHFFESPIIFPFPHEKHSQYVCVCVCVCVCLTNGKQSISHLFKCHSLARITITLVDIHNKNLYPSFCCILQKVVSTDPIRVCI